MERENELSKKILSAAFKVHSFCGPGLLESVYEQCLFHELLGENIFSERQKMIPINYKGIELVNGFRSDIIVENRVIIEIKSVEAINPVHIAQTLTYLKFSKLRLGLILNFNVLHLKEGIKRVIL